MVEPKHLQTVLDHVPSALILIGPDQKVVDRNRRATELLPQLVPGIDVWEALSPFVNEEKIDRVMRGERMLFSISPVTPILEWMVAVGPADGSIVLMVWDSSITDEVVQGRIDFLVGASHELRSPLTALLGFAEILENESGTLTPQQAEAATVIRQNAEHLHSLVDDIIDLSQSSFGELRLALEPVEIMPIVESVAETMLPQIEARGQFLKLNAPAGLPAIEADPNRIRQVVINLIQNAHVHTPAGTSIEVSVDEIDGGIRLVVQDDGEGLTFDSPDDAFRSFRRGPVAGSVTGSGSGSGIGLTITRRLAELHRGTLRVDSIPGEGCTFEAWFPLDRQRARQTIKPGLP